MNKQTIIKKLFVGLILGFLGLSCGAFSQGQTELTLKPLADQLYLVEGAGANVVINTGSDGLVIVDGGNSKNANSLIALLQKEFVKADVAVLFNTHWHPDHTGLNAKFSDSAVDIIAHENTRLWMGTEIISKWNDVIYPPQNKNTFPNKTFYYGSETIELNDAIVEYGYLPQGHTDGDIYVSFAEQNVIVAGGVIASGSYPLLDYSTGGWIGGMIDSLTLLLARSNEHTQFISSMGEVKSRADLEAQLEMCKAAIVAISQSYYAGETFQQLVASKPMQAYDRRWGDSSLFLQTAYDGAWGHVTELRRYR